jgi:hypothetical protein
MQQIRTQPAGPKAFRLYSIAHDTYRHDLGERAFTVYAALTYYVDPKTLKGTIPLKLLAQTVQCPLSTVRRCLQRLGQLGLITITPQWDAFECVQQANLYTLHALPLTSMPQCQTPMPSVTTSVRGRQVSRLTPRRLPVQSRQAGDVSARRL